MMSEGMVARAPDFLASAFDYEDGYPTDETLDLLRAFKFDPFSAARFLVNELPKIAENISAMSVDIEDGVDIAEKPTKRIRYVTGGWSGAEALISAMLSHMWIKHHHAEWKRGGLFIFEVPARYLSESMKGE